MGRTCTSGAPVAPELQRHPRLESLGLEQLCSPPRERRWAVMESSCT